MYGYSQKMSRFSSEFEEIHKEVKVCYRREFLLSLSELDSCKKLPSEFDYSSSRELSEICDGLLHLQPCDSETSCPERKPQQALSQNPENGLLGKGSFPREAGGKVGDTPSQELQTWRQNTEKGLLGKGSFPAKAECIVGVSPTEVQTCGFHLLSRSSTPYRPPHLSKVNLLSQVEISGINDVNSFGSTDFSSMEKADQERKIRDSFELMTKGEKAFQEEIEHGEDLYSGITALLGDFANDFEQYSRSERIVAFSAPAPEDAISENPVNTEDTSALDLDEISDGFDEICLPDEDSLITVEDFIVPDGSLFIPDRARSSTGIGTFFPAIPAENSRELPVFSPYPENIKSKPRKENTYVDWNAGQLNPHFCQHHANPAGNLFHSHSQTAAGRSDVQSINAKFPYHLSPNLSFSTTQQSDAWQNFYDPFEHPSQQRIQSPGRFPITHRTASTPTKNSLEFQSAKFWSL